MIALDCPGCGTCNAADELQPGALWDCGVCGAPLEASTMGDASTSATSASGITPTTALVLGGLAIAGVLALVYVTGGIGGGVAREPTGGALGWERRRERDERAESNIAPENLPLWRRIKGRFRGSPDERAEAFNEYVETDEGQNESSQARSDEADDKLDALVIERDGCTCNDGDEPRCCGRGCCSYHRGIRGRQGSEVPF